ncbi:MAG TPA: MraY family glycosyltransferase [Pirellulales bacterium]|jgi:UDP-GlcNAc:undecaprenyl-phosphate GlcNAc-1-phosphate transferase
MDLSLLADNTVKLALAAAVVASLVLSPAARALARRWGVLDNPDGARKHHGRPVPLWGGVAVYLALVVGLLVVRFAGTGSSEFDQLSTTVILACGLVCLVGCVDDSRDLNARFKLLLQILSVIPVVLAGYYFDRVVAFGYPIELGWLGIPLTVLWLVGCINSLNLLDGLDGLASVVGVSASLIMAVIAVNTGHPQVGIVALILAASLGGFLFYNLPPASIFLGDSGSMVIGLLVGMISIQGALKTSATLSIAVPAVVMSVPMLDTVFAIVRRKLSGQPFDAADRGHIHHRLLERGLTNWQALCIIGALCLTTGAAATAATLLSFEWVGWITAIALVVVLIRTRAFGHHEVALAKQQVTAAFRRYQGGAVAQTPAVAAAETPPTWNETWTALLEEVGTRAVGGFELLLANRTSQLRYSWRKSGPQAPARITSSPLVVKFTHSSGVFCQMHLLDVEATVDQTDILPRVKTLLEAMVTAWQFSGDTQPPATLRVEFHHVAVELPRKAA